MFARSIVFKRGMHSMKDLIPPNIGLAARKIESAPVASAAAEATGTLEAGEVAGELTSKDFDRMVTFYKRIPKGPAPPAATNTYKAKYVDSGSIVPLFQLIGAFLVGGYTIHYFMHIKYHKQAEHH
ncbi:ATP synthase subunit f, mitochondrial [Smittium mucronatum]|uniref:ATP synthase subunit f, mitochondrial n=1 Tax=Smittium mucronatum TaxID=133383 RepID=A0A1R0GNS7_9FUNG|nr:ATP synthase subunit f, mitochondrial [Smittium mucronatum]